jgi:hypothetical protein
VVLWSEQTKSHIGRGNSCLNKVFGLLLPPSWRQTWWLMAAHHATLYCFIDCAANADNSSPAVKKLLDFLRFLCYHFRVLRVLG